MSMYRLKHKETGLYFCKARFYYRHQLAGLTEREIFYKKNLSKTGRIYHRMSQALMKQCCGKYTNEFEIEVLK